MTTPTPPEPGIEAQSPDANGWLPIESAPKDGTEILVATKYGRQYIAWWAPWGWRDENIGFNFVTHWQPLQKPPVSPAPQSSQAQVKPDAVPSKPKASGTNSGSAT